jgi:hypothetical protein
MKKITFLPLTLLLLTACSKYQVNMISSADLIKDPETGTFTRENDSIKITYSFAGRNAPINLDVFNKLNQPLYIDWQRSAFIMDDKAVSYANNQVRINGEIAGASIGNKQVNFSNANIDAVATLPNNVVFIPPHAHVNNTLMEANSQFFETIPEELFVKKQEKCSVNDNTASVQVAEFAESMSPFKFKSYLTLYTLTNNNPKYMAYSNGFFISKTIKTNSKPDNFDFYQQNRGDYYYTTKTTGYGKVATGATIAGLLVGVAALDASQTKQSAR